MGIQTHNLQLPVLPSGLLWFGGESLQKLFFTSKKLNFVSFSHIAKFTEIRNSKKWSSFSEPNALLDPYNRVHLLWSVLWNTSLFVFVRGTWKKNHLKMQSHNLFNDLLCVQSVFLLNSIFETNKRCHQQRQWNIKLNKALFILH